MKFFDFKIKHCTLSDNVSNSGCTFVCLYNSKPVYIYGKNTIDSDFYIKKFKSKISIIRIIYQHLFHENNSFTF